MPHILATLIKIVLMSMIVSVLCFYTIFINIFFIVSCFHEYVDLIYTSIMLITFLGSFLAFVCLYFLVNTTSYFCLSALEHIFSVNKFNIIIIIIIIITNNQVAVLQVRQMDFNHLGIWFLTFTVAQFKYIGCWYIDLI